MLGLGPVQRTSSNRRRRRALFPLRSHTSTSTSTSESRWRRREEMSRPWRTGRAIFLQQGNLGVQRIAQHQSSSTTLTGDARRCAVGWFTLAGWERPWWTNAFTNLAPPIESTTWPWARRRLLAPRPCRCRRPPPPCRQPPPLPPQHFPHPLPLPPSKAWLKRNSKPSRYLAPSLSSTLGLTQLIRV